MNKGNVRSQRLDQAGLTAPEGRIDNAELALVLLSHGAAHERPRGDEFPAHGARQQALCDGQHGPVLKLHRARDISLLHQRVGAGRGIGVAGKAGDGLLHQTAADKRQQQGRYIGADDSELRLFSPRTHGPTGRRAPRSCRRNGWTCPVGHSS